MKNLLFYLTLTLVSIVQINAQTIGHDLEIFSENGKKFILYINSRQMNTEPMSSILITNNNNSYVHAKIVFEKAEIPTIEKKYLQIGNPGTETSVPVSAVYKVVVNKKGEYKLAFASRTNKNLAPTPIIIEQQAPERGRIVISW